MDKRLKESEEQYRSLFNCLAEAVILVNKSGIVFSCNPTCKTILGITNDKLIGKHLLEISWHALSQDSTAYSTADIPFVKAVSRNCNIENSIVGFKKTKDELVWTSVNVLRNKQSQNDEVDNFIISCRDISKQLNAEIGYKTIVENSLQGIIIIQNTKIVFINKLMIQMTGLNLVDEHNLSDSDFFRFG